MKMLRANFLALLMLLGICASGFSAEFLRPNLNIKKSSSPVKLDGKIDDLSWQEAQIAGDFIQQFPHDSSRSQTRTQVRMTYDGQFLYILAECFNRVENQEYVVRSLKRDFDENLNDAFQIMLDPFDDEYNGFTFMVSPFNVQGEGLLTNGGTYGQSRNWDNRWFSSVERLSDRWVAEIAIPFKTLRFNPKNARWGVNFARYDWQNSEVSCWSPIPRNFSLTSLAFTGKLMWDAPPKKTGLNVSVIPYGITELNQDYTTNQGLQSRFDAGMDAKLAVSSSLNLDLTVNPDFSQADVDRQVTNLTRFSIYFPEQRQFFLENSDLFGQFGFSKIRPFFSRQVGLRNGRRVPILFGARLSGKVNRNWRVGLLNITTAADSLSGTGRENFTVATFQRQFKGRSNIGGILVNRQDLENPSNFNRVAGIDYKLASKNGRWNGIFFFHRSFQPGGSKAEDYAHASFLRYDDANWSFMWNHEYVGKNYLATTGFVPRQEIFDGAQNITRRLTYWRVEPEIQYRWYPGGKISMVEHGLYASVYTDSVFDPNEGIYNFNTQVNFKNTSFFGINLNHNQTRLMFPIDITLTGQSLLPVGNYLYNDFSIYARSDVRRKITTTTTASYGDFYTGQKFSLNSSLQFRIPPYGLIGINYTLDDLRLSQSQQIVLNLIGPQLDFSFSRSLFFSAIAQYNDQAKNMNVFARLQWRFLPMSDVFLVYTDNYQTPDLTRKNRALVFKVVWWFTA